MRGPCVINDFDFAGSGKVDFVLFVHFVVLFAWVIRQRLLGRYNNGEDSHLLLPWDRFSPAPKERTTIARDSAQV